MSASCHLEPVCKDLCLHRRVIALCVWQILSSFCEAVTSRFYVWQTMVSIFVPDEYDFFFFNLLFYLEPGVMLLWSGFCFCLWGPHWLPCLRVSLIFSTVELFTPLCPPCGPRVPSWDPSQHRCVEIDFFFFVLSCECFSFSKFEAVNVFSFLIWMHFHSFICMHVEVVPRRCIGSTLSLFLTLIYFNPFNLLFSD